MINAYRTRVVHYKGKDTERGHVSCTLKIYKGMLYTSMANKVTCHRCAKYCQDILGIEAPEPRILVEGGL